MPIRNLKGEIMDTVGQLKFIDLSDDALKEAVGALHEYLKTLTESQANDAEIEALATELKELRASKYGDDIKATKRRLTAARKIAALRGIKFHLPKIEDADE